MSAGLAAEDSEFMLQANDVEPAGVQEGRGADIVFNRVILDLQRDGSGIVVGLSVVVHCDNADLQIRP